MNKCISYLNLKSKFEWFIKQYFGDKKLNELDELANKGDQESLLTQLINIWEDLPTELFNSNTNLEGWNEFLTLLED